MNKKSFLSVLKKNTMLIVLFVVYIAFVFITKGDIFKPANFTSLIDQNAYVYILGAGMLMCMLTGGNIDLSCGSVVCVLGALGGVFMTSWGLGTGVSILLLLGCGIVYGVVLGFLIAYVHIPPWIATLAGYLAFRGLGTVILMKFSSTSSIPIPASFSNVFSGRVFATDKGVFNWVCFGAGIVAAMLIVFLAIRNRMSRRSKGYELEPMYMTVLKCVLECGVIILVMTKLALDGGIPTVLLWVVGIVVIYGFITAKTTIGRHFYVVGGNIEAARLSGVNTRMIMFLAYLNMAVLTAVTTMTVAARFTNVYADVGKNYEMDAISACVVGGVSASGGAGTVLGMVIGATLIGVINLGMSLVSLDMNYQRIIKGFVLLAAVVFDILTKKREK